jgi:hypothetical protein
MLRALGCEEASSDFDASTCHSAYYLKMGILNMYVVEPKAPKSFFGEYAFKSILCLGGPVASRYIKMGIS